MPIVGVGIDLIETSRVERLISRNEDIFRERILGTRERNEISVCADKDTRVMAYGQSITAKEALLKAMRSGLGPGMRWSDIELVHRNAPVPQLQVSGQTAQMLSLLSADQFHLSFSTPVKRTTRHIQAIVIVSRNSI